MRRTVVIGTLVLPFLAAGARAHEGHGHIEGSSTAHYLTEPTHWVPVAVALLIVAVAAVVVRARARRRA